MTVQDQHDDTAEAGEQCPPGGQPPGVEVQNTVVATSVSSVVQAHTITGDIHLHHPAVAGRPVPRQLPAIPSGFVGRTAELDRLTAALDLSAGMLVVSAIGGAGGIGKTWLALTWAHQHLDRFPDGQLFVDLHGFSPAGKPTAPAAAVRGFLDALDVEPSRIPTDLPAQAALYRSLVVGRRMLIVLDNAATTDQVTPLLPGSPTCTVLVTGRRRLASLIDRHGAHHLTLGTLTWDEAHALLTARLGVDRVAAEPEAVEELVGLCGGFPLALSITARTAATHPTVALAEVAAELRELGLEMLDHHDDPAASLPTVLSWSLHRLTDTQRVVFALLGIAPGPDTTLPAVTALTDLPAAAARRALTALEEASLLDRGPGGRYAMHDLVRAYATTTAHALPDEVREAALVRVSDFHLHTVHAADRLLEPHRPLLHPEPPACGVHPHPLPDATAAMAWLAAEHPTLLATQHTAATLGRHAVVWHLAQALDSFHARRGHHHDLLAVWRAAADAAAPPTRPHQPHPHPPNPRPGLCPAGPARAGHRAPGPRPRPGHTPPRPHRTSPHPPRARGRLGAAGGPTGGPWTTPATPATSSAPSTSRWGKLSRSTGWAG
ncbi:NB-ARC domain-containing protein [Lentzea indica]|uniref:NB-ARC domain-containing protein n=1 Tax=Lentzea indica TaxID=2604800 RepID=UPI0028A94148|nr:NB-ARC domain-containing protein [Lentzea indica]